MNKNSVAHRRGKWRRNWSYWTMIAEVYPDGTVERSIGEHHAHGYITIEPLSDGDNNWFRNTHLQGHCGDHVYVSGTDKALVSAAFEQRISEAVGRQTGTCKANHRGDIDGVSIFEAGFLAARRAVTGEAVRMACYPYFDHDWGEWSNDLEVAPHQYNRRRVCKRCVCVEIAFSAPIGVASSAYSSSFNTSEHP